MHLGVGWWDRGKAHPALEAPEGVPVGADRADSVDLTVELSEMVGIAGEGSTTALACVVHHMSHSSSHEAMVAR